MGGSVCIGVCEQDVGCCCVMGGSVCMGVC